MAQRCLGSKTAGDTKSTPAELTAALSFDEQRAEPLIRTVLGALQDVPVARQELAPPGAGGDL